MVHAHAETVEPFKFSSRQVGMAYELSYISSKAVCQNSDFSYRLPTSIFPLPNSTIQLPSFLPEFRISTSEFLSNPFNKLLAQQTLGPKQQNQDDDQKGQGVFKCDRNEAARQTLGHAQDQAADNGTRQTVQSA